MAQRGEQTGRRGSFDFSGESFDTQSAYRILDDANVLRAFMKNVRSECEILKNEVLKLVNASEIPEESINAMVEVCKSLSEIVAEIENRVTQS